MRSNGVLDHPAGLGPADHVCWVYDAERGFAQAARQFLADGLANGYRLLCVGHPAVAAALEDVAPLTGVSDLLASGVLGVMTVGDAYGATAGLVPQQQLSFYDEATQKALADGYNGLRVVAELTALAGNPEWLPALMAWEHLADDYIAGGAGMSALCAYRRERLDGELIDSVAAVHPLVHPADDGQGGPPFRLFFEDGALALAGVVDAFVAERLARILGSTHVDADELTLDLSRLEFMDTRGCGVLAAWAQRLVAGGSRLRITGTSPVFRRVWELLGYDALEGVTLVVALEEPR